MAETIGSAGSGHPNLNLNPDEKRAYGQLLKEADPEGFGIVSGDVAVKFFERTKLPPDVLGQIWQIADTENRGFLTPSGFGVVLRLIGHAQSNRSPTAQLATQPAPLPRFDGQQSQVQQSQPPPPQTLQTQRPPQLSAQNTGTPVSPSQSAPPPIRVPALSPDKVAEYSALFEKSGAENGILSGLTAKQIFERAQLPNDVLGRIWTLSDTHSRGALDVTEFVIAMHLLASCKSGAMRGVPSTLPPGLYDAASRRQPARAGSGSRPASGVPPVAGFQPQLTGYGGRPQSPIARQQVRTPLSTQSTGDGWAITPADKARFDSIFATIDRQGRGFITGDQAVEFFGNARLPEEVLAQIWDLADINSEGQLNKDEFAVAMYLIRQQRGTKDGRGNLPTTLPPALVPPSMRRQQVAPSQPTAPAFENAPITKPRSAADDLFGLDAFSPAPTAPAQQPQSTGGTDAGPFANPSSPPFATTSPSQPQSNTFKPFVPSSSFGQSIIPQSTGSPAPNQNRIVTAPSASDDLLGDADPHESQKLTSETTELANLSNQVGTLSKQMTEVQGNRGQAERELSNHSNQKRAFEGRLAQLRSMYEKEVSEVKALQEKLTTSRNDTKRLQQEMAMIEGSHQDLSNQHQQVRAALETDQRENTSLKDRIRQLNAEVEQLRPQLEKLKSDARQHKGLVAINKKQLATNEGERDRIRAEIAAAQQQVEDAEKEAEESARQLENSKRELEEARNVPVPTVKSPPNVASPAPSTSSNPFFRKNTAETFSPSVPIKDEPNHGQNAFDNIFGPSFVSADAVAAPTTSFRTEAETLDHATPGPIATASSTHTESPTATATPDALESHAPPQSRHIEPITSSSLPFRAPLGRGDSISSSVKVAPPVSRLSPSDTPRALTPPTPSPEGHPNNAEDVAAPDDEQESIQRTLPTSTSLHNDHEEMFGKATNDKLSGIPGAFPAFETPRSESPAHGVNPAAVALGAGVATLAAGAGAAAATVTTNGDKDKGKGPELQPEEPDQKPRDSNFDDIFGGPAHQRTPSEQAADFDSAFASMKPGSAANGQPTATNHEFPAIQELEDNDDSSSDYSDETPMGFEDDFNTRSPPKASGIAEPTANAIGKQPEVASAIPSHLQPSRPPYETTVSAQSSLPDFEQQTSPPGYGEVVPEDNPSHFPREYKGLLPERSDPTSPPPTAGGSTHPGPNPSGAPPAYGPEIGSPRHASESKLDAPAPNANAPFDFDSAFAGVAPAAVEEDDDDAEEEDAFRASSRHHSGFDPTFDIPEQSRSSTAASNAPHSFAYDAVTNGSPQPPKDDFADFGTSFNKEAPPPASSTAAAGGTASQGLSHDWDDIFSGFSNSNSTAPADGLNDPTQENGVGFPEQNSSNTSRLVPATPSSPAVGSPAPAPPAKVSRPQPGRALSAGTEHDDPILKRLTSMGWNREESLAALEKYDYNIDKAADFLTFRS